VVHSAFKYAEEKRLEIENKIFHLYNLFSFLGTSVEEAFVA